MSRILGLTTLLGLAGGAFAADTVAVPTPTLDTVSSNSSTTQRVREEMHQALMRLATSGVLGAHPEQLAINIDEPAQRTVNLGLLVDSTSAANAHDGLRVLGSTPGSTAEQLGVRPGDVIVSVNGHSLRELGADERGRALAAATLRSDIDALPPDAQVQLDVRRGGTMLALNGPLQSVQLPALHVMLGAAAMSATPAPTSDMGGCGYISQLDIAPRQQSLFHATIEQIDGTTPGPRGAPRYRVAAGTHTLLVREDIPTQRLKTVMTEFAAVNFRSQSKQLTIDVKPDTTVMIASHFKGNDSTDVSRGGYWDPVAWKEVAETCR
jgi:hypothetical protein